MSRSGTPHPGKPPLPARMQRLPRDARGYVVPWFVAWVDGVPQFNIADPEKFVRAVEGGFCWVCGEKLGRWAAFVIGPMCAVNRTTSEPPCHRDCAIWSAQACPFLSQPKMRRVDHRSLPAIQEEGLIGGVAFNRNPGVACVWICDRWRVIRVDQDLGKGLLHRLDVCEPHEVTYWCEGRPATRAEVEDSVTSGMPFLREMAERQDREEPGAGAVAFLGECLQAAQRTWPATAPPSPRGAGDAS